MAARAYAEVYHVFLAPQLPQTENDAATNAHLVASTIEALN